MTEQERKYKKDYIEIYSEFIRNGNFGEFEFWEKSKNWIYNDIDTSKWKLTDWNDDLGNIINIHCNFIDQQQLYLKK